MPTLTPNAPRAATPYLIVHDGASAIAWYKQAFGVTEVVRLADPGGKVMHAELRFDGAMIMLADEFPEMGYRSPRALGGSPVSVYIYVADVDELFTRAVAAGGKESMAVADQFDGDRRGTLTDPFGHVWLLATKKESISPEELQKRFAAMIKGEA